MNRNAVNSIGNKYMQTSELKSSLVYSTSEIQRWISKDFIIGLFIHTCTRVFQCHTHLNATQPSEPQPIEGSSTPIVQDEDSSRPHHMADLHECFVVEAADDFTFP